MNKHANIKNKKYCLTEEQLIAYCNNQLSEQEEAIVEAHISECEICSDMLDGILLLNNPDELNSIKSEINTEIDKRLQEKPAKTRNISIITQIAAVALILFMMGSLYYFYHQISEKKQQIISKNEKIEQDHNIKNSITKNQEQTENEIVEEEFKKERNSNLANNESEEKIRFNCFENDIESEQEIIVLNEKLAITEDDEARKTIVFNNSQSEYGEDQAYEKEEESLLKEEKKANTYGIVKQSEADKSSKSSNKSFFTKKRKTSRKKQKRTKNAYADYETYYHYDSFELNAYKLADSIVTSFIISDKNIQSFIKQNYNYQIDTLNKGTIELLLLIDKNGNLHKSTIKKGLSDELNNEALRVVKEIKNWNIYISKNQEINTYYVLKIEIQ